MKSFLLRNLLLTCLALPQLSFHKTSLTLNPLQCLFREMTCIAAKNGHSTKHCALPCFQSICVEKLCDKLINIQTKQIHKVTYENFVQKFSSRFSWIRYCWLMEIAKKKYVFEKLLRETLVRLFLILMWFLFWGCILMTVLV